MRKGCVMLAGLLFLLALPAQAKTSILSDWNIGISGATQIGYYDVVFDKTQAYPAVSAENPGSVRVYKSSEKISNVFINLNQIVEASRVTAGAVYVMEYDYKTKTESFSTSGKVNSFIGTNWSDGYLDISGAAGGAESAWKHAKKEVTAATSVLTAKFIIEGHGVTVWLDNIKVYAKADPTATNLLKNADMTADLNTPPHAVGNLQVISSEGVSASVSWTNPVDKDFDYVKVVDRDTGAELKRLINAETSCVFENMVIDKEYTFDFIAVDVDGNESEPASVNFVQTIPSYTVSAVSFSKDALEGGNLEISINVKNNQAGDHFTVGLYTLLYKDGVLLSGKGIRSKISQTGYEEAPARLSCTVELPAETQGCKLYAYVMDGIGTMNELQTAAILE